MIWLPDLRPLPRCDVLGVHVSDSGRRRVPGGHAGRMLADGRAAVPRSGGPLSVCTSGRACRPTWRAVATPALIGWRTVSLPVSVSTFRQLLIGDPLQLPPTLPGDAGAPNGLDRTLFERLRDAGHPTTLLGTQYRVRSACTDRAHRAARPDQRWCGPGAAVGLGRRRSATQPSRRFATGSSIRAGSRTA